MIFSSEVMQRLVLDTYIFHFSSHFGSLIVALFQLFNLPDLKIFLPNVVLSAVFASVIR